MIDVRDGLPSEPFDKLSRTFRRFVRIEAMAGGVLLLCTLVALALSNSPWPASYHASWETPAGLSVGSFEFSRSLKHWVNDGLMTLFFFLVALELKLGMLVASKASATFGLSALLFLTSPTSRPRP